MVPILLTACRTELGHECLVEAVHEGEELDGGETGLLLEFESRSRTKRLMYEPPKTLVISTWPVGTCTHRN